MYFFISLLSQYAIDNVNARMRPDSGQGMDDVSSYRESLIQEPSYTARAANYSVPMISRPPSYMHLIKNHPWYTDPEGIGITLGK